MAEMLSRRDFTGLLITATSALALDGKLRALRTVADFVHPGMLHNAADLARIRDAVAAKQQPIFAGFEVLQNHPQSQATYSVKGPVEEIGRNPGISAPFDSDMNAAYQNALMWCFTGNKAHAATAVRILDAWCGSLKGIGGADAILCAGLGGFKLANAAELLRHTGAGWPAASVARCTRTLQEVFVPTLSGFAPFANGNWDGAAMKTLLAIAVFTEDRALWERVLVYYNHGCGDGRLEHYIYPNGECQESGRDQQHTQLGLAHLGDCCEIAWHQGLDLYGAVQHRLLDGFEYTARYNLGQDVPFTADVDQTGKYRHSVISPRGPLRPIYEQIFNHYTHRLGLQAPWTAKAAASLRPEGQAFGADHTGFGTVLYSRPASTREATVSAPPTALWIEPQQDGLRLEWVAPISDSPFTIERAEGAGERFTPLAIRLQNTMYIDRPSNPGRLYRYQVRSANGQLSVPAQAMSGLNSGWHPAGSVPGTALFDGDAWRISAGAPETAMKTEAQAFRLLAPGDKPRSLTARLLPLFASQSLRTGLVIGGQNEAEAMLLVGPVQSGNTLEHPQWGVTLLLQTPTREQVAVSKPLPAAVLDRNRVMKPISLRLAVDSGQLHAAISVDHIEWQPVGDPTPFRAAQRAGLVLDSGIPGVNTTVIYDKLSLLSL